MRWTTVKAIALQAVIVCAIMTLLLLIASTTFSNLNRLGVQSGFGFLFERAGFDINQSLISYSPDSPFYKAFCVAVLNTLLLAVLSITLSTIIGVIIAIFRTSSDWFLNAIGSTFIEIFRNIPALLQIFLVYFIVLRSLPSFQDSIDILNVVFINNRGVFFPAIKFSGSLFAVLFYSLGILILSLILIYGFSRKGRVLLRNLNSQIKRLFVVMLVCISGLILFMSDIDHPEVGRFGYRGGWLLSPELIALVIGLAVYNASYIAEIVRAGFNAIPKGQGEAARALGLKSTDMFRYVIFPQAMRVILPPLTNIYINIFKATSLGAAIGYPEIVSVMVGTSNNLVGRPVEIMFITFCVYSFISLMAAGILYRINARYNHYNLP